MKKVAAALLVGITLVASTAHAGPTNVMIILADDLGYSDVGCYGGEIQTPNLDRLAENGLRFTQFYNTARCWPTRASLLTGFYAQQVRRDIVPGIRSGGRGVRQRWARLLPELLKPAGYRTYHSGKWHIDGQPWENGFDRSYYLRDQGRFFNPKVHWEDGQKLPAVEPDSGYYGTIAIADHAVKCLRDHAQRHGDQPFFSYVAFTAPHFPLHALPEDIERYQDMYEVGWASIRQQRWQRQKDMGMSSAALSDVEREVGPPYHFPEALEILGDGEVNRPLPWNELTEQQQRFQASKMAIHAAMIDRMDQEIGRILQQLQQMEFWENTLIFFLSDNGASAEIMVRDDGHDPAATPGSAATYLCLGPGWSTTCNTPFRRHKTWVHEGGIATPLIVHWPAGIKAKGEIRHQLGHVIDMVPTVLEVAGVRRDGAADDPQVPLPPGQSLVTSFQDDVGTQSGRWLWWCHEENRAVRIGDWKLVAAKGDPWELYDLAADRSERQNLVAQRPEVAARLERFWTDRWNEFQAQAAKGTEAERQKQDTKAQRTRSTQEKG